MIRLDSAASTHVGRVREVNQDRALVSGQIAAVADGMGGHAGGDKAAALAIAELSGIRGTISAERLVKVVQAANKRIFKVGLSPALRGMGTTIVAAVVDSADEVMSIVNVGDSRGYQLRDGQFSQVTEDHSLVEDLMRAGQLTAEEAKIHPKRNIVTRVLGIGEAVDVDVFPVNLSPGDRYVLCSDGLTNEVDDAGIVAILNRNPSAAGAAEELVTTAVNNGGRDNVTVAVIDIFAVEDSLDGRGVSVEATPTAATPHRAPPLPESVRTEPEVVEVEPVEGEVVEVGPVEGEVLEVAEAPEPAVSDSTALLAEVGLDPDAGLDDPEAPDAQHDGARSTDPNVAEELSTTDPQGSRLGTRAIVGAVGGVLAVVLALWAIYSHNDSYFAQEVDGEVVIMHGRPDGFLWIEPEAVQQTGLRADGLNGLGLSTLEGRPASSTQTEAMEFVESLFSSEVDTDATPGG